MQWSRWAQRLVEIDWTGKPQLYILTLVFFATRLPLVNLGFGADSDAWRIALSAYDLRNFGIYHPSRFPGYPVPEAAYALVIDAGWIGTNVLTSVVSFLGVLVFARILKCSDVRDKGLLVLTFAFCPIIWVNSVVTMDYMWALTFIILTWYFLINDRPAVSGVMMGLAVGSRLTAGAFLLPFLFLLWTRARKAKDFATFLLLTTVVSLAAYAPLFVQYGLSFLTYKHVNMTLIGTGSNLVMLVGLIPLAFVLVAFGLASRNFFRDLRARDRETLFLLLAMAVVLVPFLLTPYASEYLIPIIPFGLLLLNKISKKKQIAILFVLLLVTSGVAVTPMKDEDGQIRLHFEGALVQDVSQRIHDMDVAISVVRAAIPDHSIIIVGSTIMILVYLNYRSPIDNQVLVKIDGELVNPLSEIHYVHLLPLDVLQSYLSQDYSIYYISGIESYTVETYGYSLRDYNCTLLSF